MASHSRARPGPAAAPRKVTGRMEHQQPRWLRAPITRGQSRHFLSVLKGLKPGELQQLAAGQDKEINATLIGIAVTGGMAVWNRRVPSDEPLLVQAVANFAKLVSLAASGGAIEADDAAFVWETLMADGDDGRDPDKMALLRRAGHRWLRPGPEDPGTGIQA